MILHHSFENRHSLVTEQTVLCYDATRANATAILESLGQPVSILDTESDPGAFRSTWAAAISSQLLDLRDQSTQFLPAADGEKLAERIDALAEMVSSQQAEFLAELEAAWQRERPERVEREFQRRLELLRNLNYYVGPFEREQIRGYVEGSVE